MVGRLLGLARKLARVGDDPTKLEQATATLSDAVRAAYHAVECRCLFQACSRDETPLSAETLASLLEWALAKPCAPRRATDRHSRREAADPAATLSAIEQRALLRAGPAAALAIVGETRAADPTGRALEI